MVGVAMRDTVADGRQPVVTEMGINERQQCIEDGRLPRCSTRRPTLLGQTEKGPGIIGIFAVRHRTVLWPSYGGNAGSNPTGRQTIHQEIQVLTPTRGGVDRYQRPGRSVFLRPANDWSDNFSS